MIHLYRRISLAVLLACCFGLLTLGVALAGNFVANTTDDLIDTGWAGTSPVAGPGDVDPSVDPGYDIDTAWMATNTTVGVEELSFRVLMEGAAASDLMVSAHIDCNNNSVFDDPEDRIVSYDTLTDSLEMTDGDGQPITGGEPGGILFGERVGVDVSAVNIEFRTGTSVDWSACFGTVQVYFETDDGTASPPPNENDSTVARSYNMPTAIEVQNISASSPLSLAVVAIGLGIAGLAAFALLRRRA